MPRPDPTALLCESCGYPIGELPREGNCPECGRAIAESLPERRVGTPWQQGPGLVSWLRTISSIARCPIRIWDTAKVDAVGAMPLLIANAALAMVTTSALFTVISLSDGWERTSSEVFAIVGIAIVISLFGSVGLLLLIAVEYAGIRFYGARRRWRITREVALAIVAHASVGWLLLPLTLPTLWVLVLKANDPMSNGLGFGRADGVVLIAAFFAGPLTPLLAFQTLVSIGFRRMRFANTSRPQA